MTPKSMVNPLNKMLVTHIVDAEVKAPHRNFGNIVFNDDEVVCEVPHRNVGEGGVEFAEVGGDAPH